MQFAHHFFYDVFEYVLAASYIFHPSSQEPGPGPGGTGPGPGPGACEERRKMFLSNEFSSRYRAAREAALAADLITA